MADDKSKGIYGKYSVERVDGRGINRCIVLELEDPNTWPALRLWVDTVEAAGYGPLASDVRRWVLTQEKIAKSGERMV